jgi:hypothetical protein
LIAYAPSACVMSAVGISSSFRLCIIPAASISHAGYGPESPTISPLSLMSHGCGLLKVSSPPLGDGITVTPSTVPTTPSVPLQYDSPTNVPLSLSAHGVPPQLPSTFAIVCFVPSASRMKKVR